MPPTKKELEESSIAFALALDRAIDDTQAILLISIKRLEKRILNAFKELKTTEAGSLLGAKTNLKQAQEIHKQLTKYFEETYDESVRSTKAFAAVAEAIQENWPDVDESIEFTGIDKTVMKTLAEQSMDEFIEFGNHAREKIAAAMYDHVVAHGSFGDLVTEMRKVLGTGLDKRGNNMARYAELWANDAIMNFQQAVHVQKAKDSDLRSYLYYGNIIKTTRPFCIDRAGKVYSTQAIKSWDDMPWKGKRGPAMIYRGGWNCRHHWRPVKPEWVPEGGIPVGDYFKEHGIEIDRGTTLPDKPKKKKSK